MQFCFLYFETITHMMYVFNLIINIITYLNYNEIINLQIKHDLYLITFNIPRFQLFYNYGLFFFHLNHKTWWELILHYFHRVSHRLFYINKNNRSLLGMCVCYSLWIDRIYFQKKLILPERAIQNVKRSKLNIT